MEYVTNEPGLLLWKNCLSPKKQFRLLLIVLLLISFKTSGQHPDCSVKNITISDGLSSSGVNSVFKDKQGFLWIGTNDGLNRYDGYSFKIYRKEHNNPNSLSDNKVRTAIQDSKGRIWIGTKSGLNLFDPQTETFRQFLHKGENDGSITSNEILTLFEDSQHNIWVGTEDGLNRYIEKSGTFIGFSPTTHKMLGKAVLDILEDDQSNIWFCTWGGGYHLVSQKDFSISFPKNNQNTLGKTQNFFSAVRDQNGNIWATNFYGGLNKINPQTHESEDFYPTQPDGSSLGLMLTIEADSGDFLWIGTTTGLYHYDTNSKKIQRYCDDGKQNSLASNRVNVIFKDSNDALWIGTSGGLSLIKKEKKMFEALNLRGVEMPFNVYSILADSSVIWIGSDKGLLKYNRNNNTISHFKPQGNSNSLIHHVVDALAKDKEGTLYIGTNNGLSKFNPRTDAFKNITFESHLGNLYNDNGIKAILVDAADRIWLGTDAGVKIISKDKPGYLHLYHSAIQGSLSSNHVSALYKDSHDRVWVGTNGGGINLFDSTNMRFQYFTYGDKKNSLSNNQINAITEDSRGRIFVCTNDGLNIIDLEKDSTEIYNHNNGLPSNVVLAALEDRYGNIWLTTGKGISRFNPITGRFSNYADEDGVNTDAFNNGAFFRTTNGELFVGGRNFVYNFTPEDRAHKAEKLPIYITRININNKPYSPASDLSQMRAPYSTSLKIGPGQQVISFEYAAVQPSARLNAIYLHKLEGFDHAWQESSTRTASYSNLAPGTYTFRIKALSTDGATTIAEKQFQLHVMPPFWKTWWAYAIYTFLLAIALYFYRQYAVISVKVRNRLLMERLENKKIAELTESKMRFFTNISHEIRTPLSLIAGPLQKVLNEGSIDQRSREYLNMVAKNVKRLLDQNNNLLQLRKIDMGYLHLNANETKVVPFLDELVSYFEAHATLKGIRIQTQYNVDTDLTIWLDRELITTAFYNILSNAIKFTNGGGSIAVTVSLSEKRKLNIFQQIFRRSDSTSNGGVVFEIRDTGIGIPAKDLKRISDRFYQAQNQNNYNGGSGIGLSLVKEYVELHKGSLHIQSRLNSGTIVTISLPDNLRIEHSQKDTHHLTNGVINSLFDQEGEVVQTLTNKQNFSTETPLLLIVDDDRELLHFLMTALEKNFRTATASNGAEALQIASEIQPDLIISDVAMPELDGYAVCREIKNNMNTNHIPVILLTAKGEDENIAQGYESGADAYIPKPFNISILEIQISAIILSRKKIRERYQQMLLTEPSAVQVESPDQRFLKKLMESIEKNISDEQFDVTTLVELMSMSHTVIYKKLKALTGLTLVEFIKNVRLKRAAMLLKQERLPIAEVCYQVGFSDPRYFSKCFAKQFGQTPSEYSASFHKKAE